MSVTSLLSRIKEFVVEGRKRKSEEPSEASTINFAKYRRITDDFPKYISTPLSNDFHSKSEPISDRLRLPVYSKKIMSDASNSGSGNKQSAYFGATGKTRLEFADIEFSDDEDEVDWFTRQQQHPQQSHRGRIGNAAGLGASGGGGGGTASLRHPPPLTKLKPSLAPVPSLFPIRTKLTNGTADGYSSRTSDTFKKPFVFKSQQGTAAQPQQQSHHAPPQAAKRNSIIAQSYNMTEVNNYRALLKRLLPNLYSPEEPQSASASRKNSLLLSSDDINLSSSTAINHSLGEGKAGPSTSGAIRSIPVIDLSLEESDTEGRKKRTSLFTTVDLTQYSLTGDEEAETAQVVDPVNTLQEKLQTNIKFREDIVDTVQRKYGSTSSQRKDLIAQERENVCSPVAQTAVASFSSLASLSNGFINWFYSRRKPPESSGAGSSTTSGAKPVRSPPPRPSFVEVETTARRKTSSIDHSSLKELKKSTQEYEVPFERKLGDFMLKFDTIVLDEEESEEEEEAYPELTDEYQGVIKRALYGGSRSEVIINKFNISITRNDLATLIGDNWLNDEVINFYMNLLMERSEQRADDGLPRVYAMNTFFIPKLLSAGHAGLKRCCRFVKWTIVDPPMILPC